MDLFAYILAASSTPKHCFYQNWGFAGVLATLAVPMSSFFIIFILKKQNWIKDYQRNLILAKESVATVFMETVISEAQLLLSLIEEHLPDSITQALKTEPRKTNFDYFCEKLKKIDTNLDENPRNLISQELKNQKIFSGLITDESFKLLNIIKFSSRLEHTPYNSTRISYSLQGGTSLKFSIIAKRLFALERMRKKHAFCLDTLFWLFLFSLLSAVSSLVPIICDRKFSYIWGIVSLVSFVVSAFLCIVFFAFVHKNAEQLTNIKTKYENDFEGTYENWKIRNQR